MKTLFAAKSIIKGGRSGTVHSPGHLLGDTLGNPLEKDLGARGSNPEHLFAGAYSACYHGALNNAAGKSGTPVEDSTAHTLMGLVEDDQGGYSLVVELHALRPGTTWSRFNESGRTAPARIPKPCGATPLSKSPWIEIAPNSRRSPTSLPLKASVLQESFFAVTLTAIRQQQNKDKST